MNKCTILLTCVGGLISPSQIDSFKNNPDHRKVKVVGVDMRADAVGRYMADAFYVVPLSNSSDYVDKVIKICKKEGVGVIFPTSHEESLVLAKNTDKFRSLGIVVAVSDYKVLNLAFDKAKAYTHLVKHNLPCARFFVVDSVSSLKKAANELGFPERDIVMKPALSRGGRGARILTRKSTVNYLLYEKPGSLYMNFNEAVRALQTLKNIPTLVLMEYLPGEYYSVDCLAKEGEALIIVPKVRVEGNPSQTLVGLVKKNNLIESAIRDICRAFCFNFNFNIEMKCSEDGTPLPYDLNPRLAASTAFCTAAGANLVYYALRLALNEDIPQAVAIKNNVKMIRYLKELYVS